MKKIWCFTAAVLCLCLCFCASPTDDDESGGGAIYGFVTDKVTGEHIRDAGVQLRPSGKTTVTGSNGRYEFSDVEAGGYSITVTKAGYRELIDPFEITVKSNATVQRDVQIVRSGGGLRLVDGDGTENDITGLNFGNADITRAFSILNDAPDVLEWETVNNNEWITINPARGTLGPNKLQPVTVTINRGKQGEGVHSAAISITSNLGVRNLTISTQTVMLTLNANPTVGGKVSRSPEAELYAWGTTVTITAAPESGYEFKNWTGGEVANANSASTTVTLNSNAAITANFQRTGTGPGPEPGASLADQLRVLLTNAESDGEYTIKITANESIGAQPLLFSNNRTNITVWITGIGGERTVTLVDNGSLFTINAGINLILDSNVTLRGRSGNNAPLVKVNGRGKLVMKAGAKISGNSNNSSGGGGVFVDMEGDFTMEGGEISGNTPGGVYVAAGGYFLMKDGKISGNTAGSGGGVYAAGIDFTMTGGEISNNKASYGGGVYVYSGTFTMENGRISGNESTTYSYSSGGGVYVHNGTFTMEDGEISGNTTASVGGGVYAAANGRFTKTGGTIYGYVRGDPKNNTARAGIDSGGKGHAAYIDSNPNKRRETTAGSGVNLDSNTAGAGGGWE